MAAYISILGDPPIEGGDNRFSVDGRRSIKIFHGSNLYKIDSGKHTVIITSDNGNEWAVEADLSWNDLLTIKTSVSGGAICHVQYKVGDAPPMIGFGATKL